MSGVCKTKNKRIVHKYFVTYSYKDAFQGVWVNNSDTITYDYWNCTIKQMDGRRQKPDFPLLKWEVTDKQEKARMINVVMAQNWETSI